MQFLRVDRTSTARLFLIVPDHSQFHSPEQPMRDSSYELLRRTRRGDPIAASELVQRYTERLLALARSRLSRKLARRIDAEDVLQSAYRSFFVHARQGEFDVEQDGDLWRLLATITLNKLARQATRHRAKKRSVDREVKAVAGRPDPIAELADREPSVVDVVAAADELRWLFTQLEAGESEAIRLRLQSFTAEEIATRIGRSERTVRRWLTAAKALLANRLADIDEAPDGGFTDHPRGTVPSDSAAPLRHADYHLQALVGSGGTSKVYVATERSTGRRVAVKVLRKLLRGRPDMIGRFVQEAGIVARIAHPHIVPVHGLGRLPDGGYFMVMDYVAGADLAQICRKEPVEAKQAARIVATVAEPVQHAHDNGVIHRDLKPGNVLIDLGGEIFVTDFGFAWLEGDPQPLRDTIAGTVGFMAPEQIDRRWGEIGPHTDVHGLGALLFMLLSGAPPYPGKAYSEINSCAVAADELLLDAIGPPVPNELRTICKRCLAKSPTQRFATARAVADALHEWIQKHPIGP
jgi:eukaryotic-like serine/threonine-protein kinase